MTRSLRGAAFLLGISSWALAAPGGAAPADARWDVVRRGVLVDAGCALADGSACAAIASALHEIGTPSAVARAIPFEEKACDLGVALACEEVALHLMRDSFEKSNPFLERACVLGDGGACTLLGGSYLNGLGVAEDAEVGRALLERGCDLGHGTGCVSLAVRHLRGSGVPKDRARAVALFERACDLGQGYGCREVGRTHAASGTPEDVRRGHAFLERGCELEDATSCADLASALQDGRGTAPDPERAARLRLRACAMGLAWACADGAREPPAR